MAQQADFKGTDHQQDTYYQVAQGRLKLREGNIENNLIYYKRPDQAGPKQSDFTLLPVAEPLKLKAILAEAIGEKVVVKKKRDIYYLQNVKFHIDEVDGLGSFVEIEAGNLQAPHLDRDQLLEQCTHYLEAFGIREGDLLTHSYSDMLAEK